MSDPVTSIEIEDVLASIRRLVAEGDHQDVDARRAKITTSAQPEKLVLTPALRVAHNAAAIQTPVAPDVLTLTQPVAMPPADSKPAAPAPRRTSSFTDRATLEATIAELEAAVTAQPDEWEPDGSEIRTVPTWASAGFPPQSEVQSTGKAQPGPVSEALLLEDAIEGLPIRRPKDDITPNQDQMLADIAAFKSAANVARQAPPDDAATRRTAVRPDSSEDAATGPAFRRHSVRTVDEDEDYGDELIGGSEAALADDDDIDAYLAKGAVIDEVQLRALIVEAVRNELQGRLGERITRNVRKLVRSEIHQFLSSEEFD
jgi:hypothetical protein